MSEKKIKRKVIRITMLGDSAVGKTSLISKFLNQNFDENYLTTIGKDKLEKKVVMKDGNEIKLIIWDTAGSERYRRVSLNIIKNIQGGIVVFDVTSKQSFENISIWLKSIYEINPNLYLILFGNKIDKDKSEWEVTNEEINKFVEEKKLNYFEVSAKHGIGIKTGINYIVNELCKEEEKEYIVIKPRKK